MYSDTSKHPILPGKGLREDSSWTKTLSSADATGIQEYGGVVMINTRNDNTGVLYSYIEKSGAKTSYNSPTVTVKLDWKDESFGLNQGGEFCVLLFHPPLIGITRGQKRSTHTAGTIKIIL